MIDDTLRSLLAGLIDYAGLFPPAGLGMPAATREYARQRASGDAWILGRFVVPVGRLDEMERAAEGFWLTTGGVPWRLSVLTPGEPAEARRRIDAFQRIHVGPGHAVIDAIEHKVDDPAGVAPAMAAFAGLEAYFEIPHQQDPRPFMAALAEHGGLAKIRTGGITADAFPTSTEVARFILAASAADIPFKATAGLHHPLRGEYRLTYDDDSPSATMHGFLNVFLASAAVKAGGPGQEEVEALLEEREVGAFSFTDGAVHWRHHKIDAATIATARAGFSTSYGSCSFREPVADLRELKLLR